MNNKICVYAICKNEINNIERWLNSMSEADYMVVLDTGSTDGTFEKLKEDSRVFRVEQKIIDPWRFDVARNASMLLIPDDANILVCTDLDEAFNSGWAEIVRNNWTEEADRGLYRYSWSFDALGVPNNIFIYDKIHSRNYYWVYPVHEVLHPIITPQPEVRFYFENLFLQHYQEKTKERDYLSLLELSVQENPEDCRSRMLLAREHLILEHYTEALENYLCALDLDSINEECNTLELLECLYRTADLYLAAGDYTQSIVYALRFLQKDQTYREPWFVLSQVYGKLGLYSLAMSTLDTGLLQSTRKYNWVENSANWDYRELDVRSVYNYYMGNVELAIQQVLEALKHAPEDERLLTNFNIYKTALEDKNE